MGRPESPLDPGEGPLQRLAFELRKLRVEAGSPTYREMAARTGTGASTLSQAAAGERLATLPTVLAYVRACGGNPAEWEERWRQAARDLAGEPRPEQDDADPPYRGLQRFEPGDHELFFGRDALSAQLAAMVLDHRLVAVVGASGSGKSSLLRAGLIPALQDRCTVAPGPSAIRIFTPGPHPGTDHARLLEPAVGDGDTVVVIDQFEELFTLGADHSERAAFLDRLVAACAPGGRLRVVIAVRADFFGRCADNPDLAQFLRDATLLVGPMNPTELREAVVKPAAAAGLIVGRDLISQIIEDLADEPGGLPLMSHALLETWRRRRGRALTLQMYQAAGGIHGAVAATAEAVYASMSPDRAAEARRILLRLVTPGDGAQDTRRPADRTELETGSPQTGPVLEQLAKARLVILDGDLVDLAHEALISAWPRYRAWIDQSRERLRLHRRLTEAARVWTELDRDPGALYRGTRLALAEDAFGGSDRQDREGPGGPGPLTAVESAFLDASLAVRDIEARAAVRTARRLGALVVTLAALLALAVTAGLTACSQNQAADRARQTALSRQLAAESGSLIGKNNDVAMLLAAQAYKASPTGEANTALKAADDLPLRRTITGNGSSVSCLAFSHDGRTLAWAKDDGTVLRTDNTTTDRPSTVLATRPLAVSTLAFSTDNRTLVTADENAQVQRLDPGTGKTRTVVPADFRVTSQWLSPDGRTLVESRSPYPPAPRHGPATVVLRATIGGRTRTMDLMGTEPRGDSDYVRILGLSPDRRTLATTADPATVTLWDTATGHSSTHLTYRDFIIGPDTPVAFSPDGHYLATGNFDSERVVDDEGVNDRVLVWNTTTGDVSRILPTKTLITSLAFSPDGRTLAGSGDNGTTSLWDTLTDYSRITLTGYTSSVNTLAFSPDGTILATGAADGTVRLWDPAGRTSQLGRIPPYLNGPDPTALAFSPDGRTLATGASSGSVILRDTATGHTRSLIRGHPRQLASVGVGFGPGGYILAIGDTSGTLQLRYPSGHDRTVTTGQSLWALSQDGRTLITIDRTTLRLWDTATGRTRAALKVTTGNTIIDVTLSPQGRTLAMRTSTGEVRVARRTGSHLRTLSIFNTPPSTCRCMALSPDGRTLATGGNNGTVRLWNVATGRAGTVLTSESEIVSLTFSPDSRSVAIIYGDGIRIRDTATGKVQQNISTDELPLHHSVAFSPNGRTLALLSWQGASLTRNVTPSGPAEIPARLCTAVGRNLTPEERATYEPGSSTQAVCRAPSSSSGAGVVGDAQDRECVFGFVVDGAGGLGYVVGSEELQGADGEVAEAGHGSGRVPCVNG